MIYAMLPIAAFSLAALLVFQGTEPLVVQAAQAIENLPRNVDFSMPDELSSLEEAGIVTDSSPESETGENTPAADVPQEETPEETEKPEEPEETGSDAISDTEETADESPAEDIELREPEDYYPLEEEPEGTLVDYDTTYRTYQTGDKQYMTVFGGYVGTYEDENGEIQMVDNTLEENGDVYQNTANDYDIQIPAEVTEDTGITVSQDEYSIEILPLDGDYTRAVQKENAVLYNQVYEDVDVQYTVLDKDIKEDIILQAPVEQDRFSYELIIPGLEAELADNQLYLYPEGMTKEDAVYLLEAPSMEDAAGELSTSITLSLEETEDKKILTVTPDADWLADPDRVYPVRIDPSTVNIGKSSFALIGVEEGSPALNIGDNGYPFVGYDDGITAGTLAGFNTAHLICRTYIQIDADFSVIPADSKIDSATFSVSQRTSWSKGNSQFALYRVDEPWTDKITWNSQPLNHTFVDVQQSLSEKNVYINYNVKDLVNDWVQGLHPNYGIVLKATDEANGLAASMQCEILNNKNSTYGPKLTIEWSSAEDPFLRDMSLDDTTVNLRPMTEKSLNGKLQFDGVFPDGLAKSKSIVEYYLSPEQSSTEAYYAEAQGLYSYPDSTEYNKHFPDANKYYSKDSNWQGALYTGLDLDKLYTFKAKAYKDDAEGKEVSSDSFVIYKVKQYDTFPKIAKYYGVPLADIMKDNQVQDALVVANNTIFIRNPKTNVPYNPEPLTDIDKMRIDGALMGRGLHCEFGFEPINLNTGNFYMEQTDATLDDLGGAYAITRSYNSKGTDKNSMFGRGWTFFYDQALSQLEDGTILYMRDDGSILFFDRNEDGSYTAPAGYVYDLKQVSYENTDHDYVGWEITDADQTVYSFDTYGMLRFITDKDGFQTTLNYTDDYSLESITTPSGKIFGLKQNEQGYVTGVTLPDGNKLSYTYDEKGNLTSYTDANGAVSTYQYDTQNRMVSWTDANGNTVVQNTYDEDSRVIQQVDANGETSTMEYREDKTITTDNEGYVTTYKYDDQYRTECITYPDKTRKLMFYNDANQLEREVSAKGSISYTYDGFGNIASQTREDGLTASWAYNEENRLVSTTDYNGAQTTYGYDGAGNVSAVTMPDGSVISYQYDNLHGWYHPQMAEAYRRHSLMTVQFRFPMWTERGIHGRLPMMP